MFAVLLGMKKVNSEQFSFVRFEGGEAMIGRPGLHDFTYPSP
jgi:hypothetical protein